MIKHGEKIGLILAGAGIGFLNGFLGGGGGILVVCVLTSLLKLPQKEAHATALLVILPITVVSAIVYIFNGSVDWLYALFATIGVVIGGIIGALALKNMNPKAVQIIFTIVLLTAGLKMLFS